MQKVVEQAKAIKAKKDALPPLDLDDYSEAESNDVLAVYKMELPEYISGMEKKWEDSEGNNYWLGREYGITVTELNQLIEMLNN